MPLKTNASGSDSEISCLSSSIRERISSFDHVLRTVGSTSLYQVESTAAPGNAVSSAVASAFLPTSRPHAGGEVLVTTPSAPGIRGCRTSSYPVCQYDSEGSAASITPTILAEIFRGESRDGATTTTSPGERSPNLAVVVALITASIIGPKVPRVTVSTSGLPSTKEMCSSRSS